MNCEICPSKKDCSKIGRDKYLAQLGQCRNCKAMHFVGRWEHLDQNVGHKTIIECVQDLWWSKHLEDTVMIRGHCGICGSRPLKIQRWGEDREKEVFGEPGNKPAKKKK